MIEKKILLRHLDNTPNTSEFKRYLWAGVRKVKPELHYKFRQNQKTGKNISFRQEIKAVGLFPTVLVWETHNGEKKYAKVLRID